MNKIHTSELPFSIRSRIAWKSVVMRRCSSLLCRLQGYQAFRSNNFLVFSSKQKKTRNNRGLIFSYSPLNLDWLSLARPVQAWNIKYFPENHVVPPHSIRSLTIKLNFLYLFYKRIEQYSSHHKVNAPSKSALKKSDDSSLESRENTTALIQYKKEIYQAGDVEITKIPRGYHNFSKEQSNPTNRVVRHYRTNQLKINQIMNKSPRHKQRGIMNALQAADFQPSFAPKSGEVSPKKIGSSILKERQPLNIQRIQALMMQDDQPSHRESPASKYRPVDLVNMESSIPHNFQRPDDQNSYTSLYSKENTVTPSSSKKKEVTLLDELYELGTKSIPVQGLNFREFSSENDLKAATRKALEANAISAAPSVVQTVRASRTITMDQSEIMQIADKVSRLLQQRERLERERKGYF